MSTNVMANGGKQTTKTDGSIRKRSRKSICCQPQIICPEDD
jgi:hypothetical protein